MAHRRALPGTVVPWSPDFPRPANGFPSKYYFDEALASRGRPALWRDGYRRKLRPFGVRLEMPAFGGKRTLRVESRLKSNVCNGWKADISKATNRSSRQLFGGYLNPEPFLRRGQHCGEPRILPYRIEIGIGFEMAKLGRAARTFKIGL